MNFQNSIILSIFAFSNIFVYRGEAEKNVFQICLWCDSYKHTVVPMFYGQFYIQISVLK